MNLIELIHGRKITHYLGRTLDQPPLVAKCAAIMYLGWLDEWEELVITTCVLLLLLKDRQYV